MPRPHRFLDRLLAALAKPDLVWATALAVVLLLPGYPDLRSAWATAVWAGVVSLLAAGLVFRWPLWPGPKSPPDQGRRARWYPLSGSDLQGGSARS